MSKIPQGSHSLSRRSVVLKGLGVAAGLLSTSGNVLNAQINVATLRAINLALPWLPQSQFAGYYMAHSKGFYRSQGLDVSLVHCGPGRSAVTTLLKGDVDFATFWLVTALMNYKPDLPLVNLAQMVQKSSLLLMWRRHEQIKTPADLANHRVSIWGGDHQIPFDILLKGIPVRPILQGATANLFIRNLVTACSATWYNEYYQIMNSSFVSEDFDSYFLNRAKINFPEDGLYTLSTRALADPALVKAFVAATLEGWRYAFTNVDETVDVVLNTMGQAKLVAHRPHQKWMLERMRDLSGFEVKNTDFGVLEKGSYLDASRLLDEYGVKTSTPSYEQFAWGAHV